MKKHILRYAALLTLGLLVIAAESLPAQTPTPAGGEFQANTYTTNNQWRASLATSAMGDFVVTWDSRNQDGSSGGLSLLAFFGGLALGWLAFLGRGSALHGSLALFGRSLALFSGSFALFVWRPRNSQGLVSFVAFVSGPNHFFI